MTNKKSFILVTLGAGASLSLMSYLTWKFSTTRIIFPYSLTAYLLPVTLFSRLRIGSQWLAYVYPFTYITLAFWLCNPRSFTGKTTVPKHSFIVYVVFLFFSIWYYIEAWPYGIRYQGATYTVYVSAVSIAIAITLGILGYRARRNPSFKLNLLFHWSLFAWFQTFAFAYLGEVL